MDLFKNKIAVAIAELFRVKRKILSLETQQKKLAEFIKNFMVSDGAKEINVPLNAKDEILDYSELGEVSALTVLNCKLIEPVDVVIDAEKLNDALGKTKQGKAVRNEVINKKYVINDFSGFVRLMKELGVPANDVLRFIKPEMTINQSALENKVSLGEIDSEVVRECAVTSARNPYIKIKANKNGG